MTSASYLVKGIAKYIELINTASEAYEVSQLESIRDQGKDAAIITIEATGGGLANSSSGIFGFEGENWPFRPVEGR